MKALKNGLDFFAYFFDLSKKDKTFPSFYRLLNHFDLDYGSYKKKRLPQTYEAALGVGRGLYMG